MEIIAEVGLAHDGSMQAAHAYIDACADRRVDAVKFQCHDGDPTTEWRVRPDWCQDESRQAYWRRTGFSPAQWQELARHCAMRGVEFVCSVFSLEALRVIDPLVKRHKVPSGRIADLELLRTIGETGKPVLLSTGLALETEAHIAEDLLYEYGCDVTVLQCTSRYPCPPDQVGLYVYDDVLTISPNLRLDGLSDHSGTIYAGIAAAALGCQVLEVHVCFSKEQGNLDAAASLTMDQLAQLVEGVRFVEKAMQPVDKDALAEQLAETRRVFMA